MTIQKLKKIDNLIHQIENLTPRKISPHRKFEWGDHKITQSKKCPLS